MQIEKRRRKEQHRAKSFHNAKQFQDYLKKKPTFVTDRYRDSQGPHVMRMSSHIANIYPFLNRIRNKIAITRNIIEYDLQHQHLSYHYLYKLILVARKQVNRAM